jgi:hypothetical protein
MENLLHLCSPVGVGINAVGNALYEVGATFDNAIIFPTHPISRNLVTLIILLFYDKVFCKHLGSKCRWFRIHALANLLTVLTSLNSLKYTLLDPVNSLDTNIYNDTTMFGNASKWPLAIINTVHVYHMLAFKLNGAEYFHHLLFIPTLGFPGQFFDWAAVGNVQAFFISGLPGGIDYYLLSIGYNKLKQKRISANLNIWCRMPGLMMCFLILYQSLLYKTDKQNFPPLFFCLVQIILPPYNALYYCKQAVANYAVHYMMDQFKRKGADMTLKMSERTSKVTGGQVFSFDMSRPQRGS